MFEWVVCVKSHLMVVIECEIKTVSFAISPTVLPAPGMELCNFALVSVVE